MFGRIVAALALFGPVLIGIAAPALSFAALRQRRLNPSQSNRFRAPSAVALVVASVIWLVLCVAISLILQQVAFAFTWGWAHAERPPRIGEELKFLSYVACGLISLAACAVAVHRLLIVAKRPVPPNGLDV